VAFASLRKIAKKLDIKIRIKSEYDSSTTFSLYLPITVIAPTLAERESANAAQRKDKFHFNFGQEGMIQ